MNVTFIGGRGAARGRKYHNDALKLLCKNCVGTDYTNDYRQIIFTKPKDFYFGTTIIASEFDIHLLSSQLENY